MLRNIICRSIQECKKMKELKGIHAVIITSPRLRRNDLHFLLTRLLFVCALSSWGSLSYASLVFASVKNPCLSLYNIMIRAYVSRTGGGSDDSCARLFQSLLLYKRMLRDGISPDCITLPFILKECLRGNDFRLGCCVHGQCFKFGLANYVYVENSMISFYSHFGFLANAWNVFDKMSKRDVVSWNSMIIGYLRGGALDTALELFREMAERRNIITWNSMITGFVQGGRPKEALDFFGQMQVSKVTPDKITVASVLSACACLGASDHGRWVNGYLRRSGLECDEVIETALVDMYGKCGYVERAYEVFKKMPKKDSLAWTAMISVFALNGHAEEAFCVFEEMEKESVKPSPITFVGLLSACAHSGLVEKGRCYFKKMRTLYSIEPQVYHYACMVDILSRASLFDEAEELILSMPMNPDVYVWGALLGGCQVHGNTELGVKVAKHLINLEPSNNAYYMNLCDLYAKAGRYDEIKTVRALMRARGIKKEVPGCSMIEVNAIVHEFSIRGSPEASMDELVGVLDRLSNDMKTDMEMDVLTL